MLNCVCIGKGHALWFIHTSHKHTTKAARDGRVDGWRMVVGGWIAACKQTTAFFDLWALWVPPSSTAPHTQKYKIKWSYIYVSIIQPKRWKKLQRIDSWMYWRKNFRLSLNLIVNKTNNKLQRKFIKLPTQKILNFKVPWIQIRRLKMFVKNKLFTNYEPSLLSTFEDIEDQTCIKIILFFYMVT